MPHGRHIYAKAYDMANATMCAYPHSDHALPHWKFVLQVCAYYPYINLPVQETDNQYSETTPSIWFHIYPVEKSHHIYKTYKNTVMTHGRHIYTKSYDIEKY